MFNVNYWGASGSAITSNFPRWYGYSAKEANDTLTKVEEANYFNDRIYLLTVGDLIAVEATDGRALYVVNSVSSSVVIARYTGLGPLGVSKTYYEVDSGEITWSGSGTSLVVGISGALATDKLTIWRSVAPTESSYVVTTNLTANTLTIVQSAANTSNNAKFRYVIERQSA